MKLEVLVHDEVHRRATDSSHHFRAISNWPTAELQAELGNG
jgi:hypothetical protein